MQMHRLPCINTREIYCQRISSDYMCSHRFYCCCNWRLYARMESFGNIMIEVIQSLSLSLSFPLPDAHVLNLTCLNKRGTPAVEQQLFALDVLSECRPLFPVIFTTSTSRFARLNQTAWLYQSGAWYGMAFTIQGREPFDRETRA